MGRPKSISRMVSDIAVEHVRRIRIRQEDPNYMLSEEDAKALKTLAETQVTLQKRRPEEEDDDETPDGPEMSIEELEASRVAPPAVPPPTAEEPDDDAG